MEEWKSSTLDGVGATTVSNSTCDTLTLESLEKAMNLVYGRRESKSQMFKEGDKVRVKRIGLGCGHVDRRNVVTVTRIEEDECLLYFVCDDGESCYESLGKFELATPREFKVGDRVRCIPGENPGSGWQEGLEFEVTRVANYTPNRCCFGGRNGNGVYEHCLELVEEKKEDKPMQFDEGDEVRVIGDDYNGYSGHERGHVGTITSIDDSDDTYEVDNDYYYTAESLEKVNSQGANNMSKYFKVIKETPELEEGAILSHYSGEEYRPINTLWNKDGVSDDIRVKPESKPTYYEQVWASEYEGRTVYVDKATARELLNAQVTLEKKTAK